MPQIGRQSKVLVSQYQQGRNGKANDNTCGPPRPWLNQYIHLFKKVRGGKDGDSVLFKLIF
jgi:hypothetical protein